MPDPDIAIQGGPLYPLSLFYEQAQTALPTCTALDGKHMPQPYRNLLVHDKDMTPTLEHHHGQRLELELLMLQRTDDALMREVVLVTIDERRPVEFGAIRIELEPFEREAQDLIMGCRTPLGTILSEFDVEHICKPSAFFRVTCDAVIALALAADEACELYGRRNTLLTPDGRTIANVVEVLSP